MIRMFQSQTVAQAKDYFRDALSKADYYMEDQEMNGTFNGKIAKRLGIEGSMIDKETFEKLCDNINPKDGGSLRLRAAAAYPQAWNSATKKLQCRHMNLPRRSRTLSRSSLPSIYANMAPSHGRRRLCA